MFQPDPTTCHRRTHNPVFTGITMDRFVHTTVREANDLEFGCPLVEDCCGTTDLEGHLAAFRMVEMHGSVFGAVVTADRPAGGARAGGR